MSLNLVLVFDSYGQIYGAKAPEISTHNKLAINHNIRSDFDSLKRSAEPFKGSLYSYGDEGAQLLDKDPWGTPLTYISAQSLAKHLDDMELVGWDMAVRAFVRALPPTLSVVLWWC